MLSRLEPHRSILMQAADIIETHGHCKKALSNIDGEHCANGAINLAATGRSYYPFERTDDEVRFGLDANGLRTSPEYKAAVIAFAEIVVPNYREFKPKLANEKWSQPYHCAAFAIAKWNNAPATTKEKVVSALRQAALASVSS